MCAPADPCNTATLWPHIFSCCPVEKGGNDDLLQPDHQRTEERELDVSGRRSFEGRKCMLLLDAG
jgi:hypothetical protein